MAQLEREQLKLSQGHRRLSDTVEEMNTMLVKNNAMTSDIYDIANSLKGFGKTVGWAGKGLLFIGKFVVVPIAFVGGLGYAIFNHGRFPVWFTEMVKALFT